MLTITVEADAVSQIMWVMNPAKLGAIAPAEAARAGTAVRVSALMRVP